MRRGISRRAPAALGLCLVLAAAAGAAAAPVAGQPWLERPMDVADRRHLLLRSGIGASADELLALEGLTRGEGVAHVVAGLRTTPATPMPAWTRAPPPHYHAREDMSSEARLRFDRARDRELAELRLWWLREMLLTGSPQTERLTLFWHDLFATSYHATDRAALAMARQNATLRRLGGGSWRALLEAMIRDAALIDALDADSNRAESPNENLGRELMELYTLGVGNYTERDVAEAARALTGHGASDDMRLAFRLRSWHRDTGEKTLFGRGGVVDGDDLIERILERPAAARFLAGRFWRAFVADGEPEPDWLERVANEFRRSGHDIGVLYRATLSSEAFWAPRHRGAIVRSPIDITVGTARSLDYPKRHWRALARWNETLGMALFAPPDVAGWREGLAFVAGDRLLARRRVLARLTREEGVAPDATGAAMAGSADDDAIMAGLSAGMADDGSRPLVLRIAAEHYRGPARWRVTLLDRKGQTIWRDRVRTLAVAHDSERDGPLRDRSELPWQAVPLAVPEPVLARAEALSLRFLNDAAGEGGDRNLHLDGVVFRGRWHPAADGRQSGDCVPGNPLDAGHLYCGGTLRVPLVRVDGPGTPPPPYRASAARLRWGAVDEESGRARLEIALDDAVTPARRFHRLQFRVVATPGRAPELRVESFDCVPGCVRRWPDCAWRDELFPAARMLTLPVDGRRDSAREPCHLDALETDEGALFATLGRSLPGLLDALARSPRGARFAEPIARLRERLGDGVADEYEGSGRDDDGRGAARFVVDAAFAPPPPPPPETFAPPPLRRSSLDALAEALDAAGLDLADVLLAGLPDATLAPIAPREGERPERALARILRHPAFQVR